MSGLYVLALERLKKGLSNTMLHFFLPTSLFTEQLSLTVVVINQLSSFGSKHSRDFHQKFNREKFVNENLTRD